MNSVTVSMTSPEQTKYVDRRRSSGATCIYSRNPPAFMQPEGSYQERTNIYLFVKLWKEHLYGIYLTHLLSVITLPPFTLKYIYMYI
jgi:hypothetical protein